MSVVRYPIKLNVKPSPYPLIKNIALVQNDTANVFAIELLNNKEPFNIKDCYVTATFKKSDKNVVVSEGNIIDEANGLVDVPILSQAVAYPGKTYCTIEVYNKDKLRLTSIMFEFTVVEELGSGEDITSTSEYTILQQLIEETQQAKLEEEQRVINENTRVQNEVDRQTTFNGIVDTANTTKDGLDVSIINANTIENKLSNITTGTIKKAIDTNITLNTSLSNAEISKTNLDTSINDANTSKINLDTSIDSANTAKSNLDNSISTADTTKIALDGSITEGNVLKGDLNTIISGTDYEQIMIDVNSLKTDQHNHANKTTLDNLSDADGKLKYSGQDVGIGDMTKAEFDTDNDGIIDKSNDSDNLGGQLPSYYATKAELDNKIDNSRVLTDVPVDAKFTDTITPIVNNLTETVAGKSLDATQGKVLDNKIDILSTDVNDHQADYANFKNNIEAVKYEGDKLFLKVNGEWIEFKSGSQYPVGNVSDFSAKGDDKQVTLTWQDPADTTIDDSLGNPVSIAKWKGTKILRKTGSYPQNENDGVLVVDNGIKNQYSENGFTDVGLQNDVEYFYMAFPYTEEDVYTVDESNRISAIPTEIKIYGVEIDESNSNPETAVVYTNDAVGFTPASGNNGAFNWGSWESIIKDEFKIRPCVLNNPQKTVNYYLDYDNYNLKATGGASNLTGADGDVMTEFGADIYTKWTVVGSKHKIQFSIKPFEGATKNAFEVENGYNQFPYYPLLLTQKLFQLLFKNRDSQTALGRGYVDENSSYATTGNTNTKGFMFGETTGKQQMKFLGIEDYWGNRYQWIDGLVTDASFNILIGNSNFNDTGSGYTSHASGISANTVGYIDTVQGGNDKGFIIKGKSGSETTHYCDYGDLSSSRVAYFGGHLSSGSYAGFAGLRLLSSGSDAGAVVGSRLFCKNNGKLYIGAYLGTTQGGKLRSVSGTTSASNKTISVFRTEAQANNN